MKKHILRQFATLLAFILFGFGSSVVSAQQTVRGCVPQFIKQLGLNPVARLDTTKRLTLGIGLSLENQGALMDLIQELYDPSSPNFHNWLTPSEFTAQFCPSEKEYQAVIDYAEANGFTVERTSPNRLLLDVSGTAGNIERAFHLKMMVYNRRSGSGTFFAPDSEPNLDLNVRIGHISGLRDDIVPVAHIKVTFVQNGTPVPADGTGSMQGAYDSPDFRAAYAHGVSPNGSGQTVGLLQFSGFTTSDITTYESQTGLPNVPLSTALLDGASGLPSGPPYYYEVEVTLDIEMAIAMAP